MESRARDAETKFAVGYARQALLLSRALALRMVDGNRRANEPGSYELATIKPTIA